MDLYVRKPIGWAISFSPNSQLTSDALSMALESRGRPHRHNQGTSPNAAEAKYWKSYNSVAKLT